MVHKIFIRIFLLFLMIVGGSPGIAAEKRGEILNVNFQLNVAFTDLASPDLNKGEQVEVVINDRSSVCLDVLEVSNNISKLIPGSCPQWPESKKNFNKIKIGDVVLQLSAEDDRSGDGQPQTLQEDSNTQTKEDTTRLTEEIHRLAAANKALESKQVKMSQDLKQALKKIDDLKRMPSSPCEVKKSELALKSAQCPESNPAELTDLRKKNSILHKKLEQLSQLIREKIKGYETP